MRRSRSSSSTVATIVSMWSAMLGGAMGASIGLFGGSFFVSITFGFVGGFMCSVIMVSALLAVSYLIASMLGSEFEDVPIGCPTTSQLSGVLGGIAGGIGAVVLAQYGLARLQARSTTFAVCWSVTGFMPIIMALIVVRLTRYRETHPLGPDWLRPVVDRGLTQYEAIRERRKRAPHH